MYLQYKLSIFLCKSAFLHVISSPSHLRSERIRIFSLMTGLATAIVDTADIWKCAGRLRTPANNDVLLLETREGLRKLQ